jgi:5-formyltetrahydrofolate cyclo-ligase
VDLDPDLVAQVSGRAKRAIRARMRALRQALPAAARSARSERICARVLDSAPYRSARSVALFAPQALEVDVSRIDSDARASGKSVYYPFMDPTQTGFATGFRRVDELATLVERGRKFLEPPAGLPPAARGDIDLVVVPALAVAASGHRLGYGSGYYDATLPDVCPPGVALVVAFDFQLLAELPHNAHDVAVQIIVTDQRTLLADG